MVHTCMFIILKFQFTQLLNITGSPYMHLKVKENTFLIIGLFVGTIVTFSLYMLSNSVLSVAAVPVIPQSFGNCKSKVTSTIK